MITQSELKSILEYNENTGNFVWKISPNRSIKIGYIAGNLSKGRYVQIRINKKNYYAHRLAWLYVYGTLPTEIDHINHDKVDNSIDNLRNVTHTNNMRNKTKQKNNASGVVGVSWKKKAKRWQAQISINGKRKHLGEYISFSDAVDARKNAEILYGYHKNHGI